VRYRRPHRDRRRSKKEEQEENHENDVDAEVPPAVMIANLVVGGLAAGCLYAMVGIAIVIVLNITDIANFAQGEMAMLTTFFAYWLMEGIGLPWWQAVSIAVVFGLVQGVVIQQVVIRPLIGGPVLSAIIATLGLNVVLNSVAGLIWGHQTYTFPSPFAFSPPFLIGGVPVSVDSVVNIGVGLVIIIGMTLFLRFTWTGLALRAASQNQTVARLMGVSITRSSAIAWGLGGLVGGVAGVLAAPSLFLDTNLMSALLIKAFAGGVLGGLNSLIGVFLGCLTLGVAENLTGAYLSPSFADAITFIIIIAVLIMRPEGIFGHVKVRKA
jgi:branched-chain amino acid transport system permease protein